MAHMKGDCTGPRVAPGRGWDWTMGLGADLERAIGCLGHLAQI